MPDNMIEAKKHALQQLQTGEWKATFTIQAVDMPPYLLNEAMGKRYYIVFVDADDYDAQNLIGANSPQLGSDIGITTSEDDKLRVKAVLRCKEAAFQDFIWKIPRPSYWVYESRDSENAMEAIARVKLCEECDIASRRELATDIDAQEKFRKLDQKYKDWLLEQQYADNLNRF